MVELQDLLDKYLSSRSVEGDYFSASVQTLTCVLEVVLCKANPGLVPFQAARVKVALPLELLRKKKKSCPALGTWEQHTWEPQRCRNFVGCTGIQCWAQPGLQHQTQRAVGTALNQLPWGGIELRAETKPAQTSILKAWSAHVKKDGFQNEERVASTEICAFSFFLIFAIFKSTKCDWSSLSQNTFFSVAVCAQQLWMAFAS